MAPSVPSATPPRRLSRRARWIGSLLAVLVMASLFALAWHLTHQVPAPGGSTRTGGAGGGRGLRGEPPTTVGIATARRTDIPVVLEALGTVTPMATVTVRPQVSGTLVDVNFQEGETVKRGQLLARIDPRPFEMAVMQAEGQLARDRAQLDAARVQLERYQTLLKQDSIARQEVDTQAALVKQLDAAVLSARATLGTAKLNLDYTRVTAPIAGRAGLRAVDVGNVVSTGDVNGLVVLTQIAPIDVQFSVPQDRVPEVAAQAASGTLNAVAFDRSRTKALDTGRFGTLDNRVDTTTGTVRAKARFDNAQGTLFPSQFVNLRLQVRAVRDAIVVPIGALRHGSNGDYVFVLSDGQTAAVRNVKRGESTGDTVQIAQGLDEGERVIVEGGDRLRDGSRVVLPEQAAAMATAASGAYGGRMGGRRAASGAAAASGASYPRRQRASNPQ